MRKREITALYKAAERWQLDQSITMSQTVKITQIAKWTIKQPDNLQGSNSKSSRQRSSAVPDQKQNGEARVERSFTLGVEAK